jgi:23S rRNA pseudouridine1911/1915/1917 synthase
MPRSLRLQPGAGVKKSVWIVRTEEDGLTLDKFLAAPERLGSRSRAADAREKNKLFLNDREVDPRGRPVRLKAGDRVWVWQDRPGTARRRSFPFAADGLNVLYEDEYIIAIDKPAGVLAVPLERQEDAISVVDQLKTYLRSQGKRKPLVVHRIDRDTSGIVLFAKDGRAQAALKAQFRARSAERIYLAVVYGRPEPAAGRWRDHLTWDQKALIQKKTDARDPRGTEAISDYRVVETFRATPTTGNMATSLVEVRLQTGKRNQIRLQARLRGHTLVGEQRYTFGPDELRPIPFRRQALHAWRLRVRHPATERVMSFEAPLPGDLTKLINGLRSR